MVKICSQECRPLWNDGLDTTHLQTSGFALYFRLCFAFSPIEFAVHAPMLGGAPERTAEAAFPAACPRRLHRPGRGAWGVSRGSEL